MRYLLASAAFFVVAAACFSGLVSLAWAIGHHALPLHGALGVFVGLFALLVCLGGIFVSAITALFMLHQASYQ